VIQVVKESQEEDNYSETFSDQKEKPVQLKESFKVVEMHKAQPKPKVFGKPNFGL
jgi:hypothetical protein